MKNINDIRTAILVAPARSAWNKGVKLYALDLFEKLEESIIDGYTSEDVFENPQELRKALLNGASDWKQYSWGGCSLIYDTDIAASLCTRSELKLTRNGEKRPNKAEEWLDVQARALYQACELIIKTVKE